MTDREFGPDVEEGEARLSGQGLVHFKSRVEKAAHILEELTLLGVDPSSRLRVLCAGCGVGFVPYILARHTAWSFFGGDLDPGYIGRHPWVRERLQISRLDLTAMPFRDDTFDLVICNHVIEHVPAWEALARELHRVVRPGGLLYLATPNPCRPGIPLRYMIDPARRLPRDTRIELHAGFTQRELLQLLSRFTSLQPLNRIHAGLNCPPRVRVLLPLVPQLVYDHLMPTNVVVGRK